MNNDRLVMNEDPQWEEAHESTAAAASGHLGVIASVCGFPFASLSWSPGR